MRRRRGWSLVLVAVLAGALSACKTADAPPPPNIGARLAPAGGSAFRGSASFQQFDGGVVMSVNLAGGTPGRWRVVIHADGNCSSLNAFSAGPPVLLPGTSDPAMMQMSTNAEGEAFGSIRLPGLALEGPNGVVDKSVVVHSGAFGPLDAAPGVSNNRHACGVIERRRPLF